MDKYRKSVLIVLGILFTLLLVPIWQVLTWGREPSSQESVSQDIREQYPVADSTKLEPAEPGQRAKRLAKGRKYNQKEKSVSPLLVQSAEGYHWPVDFSAIPVALSDAVIVGEVSHAEAFLSEDRNSVYSEFTVRIEDVLSNTTPLSLGSGTSIVTERRGGRVRYPSGHVSWLFVVGQGMPRAGRRYVLFLKQNNPDQDFDILTGYELRGNQVIPIDSSPGVVRFDRYKGLDIAAFLNEVRVAISKCAVGSVS